MDHEEMRLRLAGWRLATLEVLYHIPDHPGVLQSFTWQTLDLAPAFPRLKSFLQFWKAEIEAAIHSVRIAQSPELAPAKVRLVQEHLLH